MNSGPAGLSRFAAPASWRSIDFISDLHLAEDMPLTFAAWRDYLLGTDADAVFILGDLFEAWVGDDARHGSFEAHAASVLTQATARRPMAFMVGNRDFLLGHEMLEACGLTSLDDPTLLLAFGARTLLTHGDAWCLADTDYQQMRRLVRDPAWQRSVLAQPIAERRVLAGQMRTASERRADTAVINPPGAAPSREAPPLGGFDVDIPIALHHLADAGADVLVHGHTHRPASETLAPGIVRHVLSDWDLDHDPTAPRAEVLRWRSTGWTRLAPRQATEAATR